jgi:outer membrane lipoprotein-sorting protein
MWKMVGNGVEMYCDSSALWVVDPTNKEVVIEPAEVEEKVQLQTNPAVLFVHMKELFAVRESRKISSQGTVLYILAPRQKGEIDYFNVEIAESDQALRSAVISLADGTLIKIEVSSMKLTPKVSDEAFLPQTKFDSTWIVTDLR